MLLGFSCPIWAGETVVLASGAQLRADRHELVGSVLRLFLGEGTIDLPVATVSGVEMDPPPSVTPVSAAATSAPPVEAPRAVAIPETPKTPRQLVHEAAEHVGLPPTFVESVARAESAMNPAAVSPKGAIGVMQLMPATAAELKVDPRDPKQNIEAGAALLRDLLVKYDGDVIKALAAYNAGPGAVAKYNGVPPYAETQRYIGRIVSDYQRSAPQ